MHLVFTITSGLHRLGKALLGQKNPLELRNVLRKIPGPKGQGVTAILDLLDFRRRQGATGLSTVAHMVWTSQSQAYPRSLTFKFSTPNEFGP